MAKAADKPVARAAAYSILPFAEIYTVIDLVSIDAGGAAVNLAYRVVVPRDAVAGIPADYATAIIDNTLSLLATITTTDDLIEAVEAVVTDTEDEIREFPRINPLRPRRRWPDSWRRCAGCRTSPCPRTPTTHCGPTRPS